MISRHRQEREEAIRRYCLGYKESDIRARLLKINMDFETRV